MPPALAHSGQPASFVLSFHQGSACTRSSMCYSAQIRQDYRKFTKEFGSTLSIRDFVRLYWQRQEDGGRTKLPKAMDAEFAEAPGEEAAEIRRLVAEFNAQQATRLEQELFKQVKRLADARRTLLTKTTKKAQEDVRISTDKIEWAKGKLSDLRRTE